MAGALKKRSANGRAEPHRFEMSQDFIDRLEGPKRRAGMPSEEIVSRMEIDRHDVFADLGAGIGYFTFPLALQAKSVIALDIEPQMTQILSERIADRKIRNVTPVLGEILHLPLADDSVDGVLAACVYHEVESQQEMASECYRVLRPTGRLTIVDFQKRETPFGPPVRERKTPSEVLRVIGKRLTPTSRFDAEVYYQLSFMKDE